MGIGLDKGRFHGRDIVIIIIDENNYIKEAQILSGSSVFAKFKTMEDLVGAYLNTILDKKSYLKYSKSIDNAIEQINREKNM